ncbi:MAG: ribonuclease HI family protein [Gaiellales bacterium]
MTRARRRPGGTMRDGERRRLGKLKRAERAASGSSRAESAASAVAWCDGGSRGNPGPAACAFVIEDAEGAELARDVRAIGVASAAVAEYRAVEAALERALVLGLDRLEIRSDSRLLVAHLSGETVPRSAELVELGDAARTLAVRVGRVRYAWVPRDQNGRADSLLASALGFDDPGR